MYPSFLRSPPTYGLGKDLGLLVFCACDERQSRHLEICPNGNELIISNLGTAVMNLEPLDLIEVPDVLSKWKRGFDNSV